MPADRIERFRKIQRNFVIQGAEACIEVVEPENRGQIAFWKQKSSQGA